MNHLITLYVINCLFAQSLRRDFVLITVIVHLLLCLAYTVCVQNLFVLIHHGPSMTMGRKKTVHTFSKIITTIPSINIYYSGHWGYERGQGKLPSWNVLKINQIHTVYTVSSVSVCTLSGEEPACQWRRSWRRGFDPWIRKIPCRRKWQPTPVFMPG